MSQGIHLWPKSHFFSLGQKRALGVGLGVDGGGSVPWAQAQMGLCAEQTLALPALPLCEPGVWPLPCIFPTFVEDLALYLLMAGTSC